MRDLSCIDYGYCVPTCSLWWWYTGALSADERVQKGFAVTSMRQAELAGEVQAPYGIITIRDWYTSHRACRLYGELSIKMLIRAVPAAMYWSEKNLPKTVVMSIFEIRKFCIYASEAVKTVLVKMNIPLTIKNMVFIRMAESAAIKKHYVLNRPGAF